MRRAVIWGREVEMQGGPLSYLVYKREFGGDLALDLLDAYKTGTADSEAFLRFAWTMARTCDEAVSGYEEWLREFDPDAFSVVESPIGVIDSAIKAELFRWGAAPWPVRAVWRARAAVSRWLGALARLARPQGARVLGR